MKTILYVTYQQTILSFLKKELVAWGNKYSELQASNDLRSCQELANYTKCVLDVVKAGRFNIIIKTILFVVEEYNDVNM